MEKLRDLRNYYSLQVFGLSLLVAALIISSAMLLNAYLPTSVAVAGTVLIGLLAVLLMAVHIAKLAVISSQFLAQAILHVSKERSTVGAPDIKRVPASRDFFSELARSVYDMASQALPSTDKTTEAVEGNSTTFQKSLIQNSPLAIYALDKANKLVFANQAGIEYAGLNAAECRGRPFYDLLRLSFASDITLDKWLSESAEGRLTGNHTWDRVRLNMADGSTKQCDIAARFSKDNPEGVEAVVMLFDHTDKYQRDEHGLSVISMAVHELRTPLTVMRGYIEVFEDEVASALNEEQAEFMRGLSAQAQQLSSFVNNIQNFAKLEENELGLSLKEDDWSTVLTGAVKDMELRARVRHKTLRLEIDDNLPSVAVDRATIYEVVVNLVENAIKYTRNDDPIVIRASRKDDGFVETTVEDKGIGIPNSLIGHIFEKFYRSHRSNKSVGGTGLGLYLAKAIVTAHGGQIWVKTKEGQGSTFGFTVPTFSSVAGQANSDDNKTIVRGAHGWIKNHSLYRG